MTDDTGMKLEDELETLELDSIVGDEGNDGSLRSKVNSVTDPKTVVVNSRELYELMGHKKGYFITEEAIVALKPACPGTVCAETIYEALLQTTSITLIKVPFRHGSVRYVVCTPDQQEWLANGILPYGTKDANMTLEKKDIWTFMQRVDVLPISATKQEKLWQNVVNSNYRDSNPMLGGSHGPEHYASKE